MDVNAEKIKDKLRMPPVWSTMMNTVLATDQGRLDQRAVYRKLRQGSVGVLRHGHGVVADQVNLSIPSAANLTAALKTQNARTDWRLFVSGGSFPNADMSGARMIDGLMSETKMPGADFSRTDFSGTQIEHTDMKRASFKNSVGSKAYFSNVDFSGADFSGADLNGVRFFDCNLEGASFEGANLSGTVMVDCKTEGVDFSQAKNVNMDMVSLKTQAIPQKDPASVKSTESVQKPKPASKNPEQLRKEEAAIRSALKKAGMNPAENTKGPKTESEARLKHVSEPVVPTVRSALLNSKLSPEKRQEEWNVFQNGSVTVLKKDLKAPYTAPADYRLSVPAKPENLRLVADKLGPYNDSLAKNEVGHIVLHGGQYQDVDLSRRKLPLFMTDSVRMKEADFSKTQLDGARFNKSDFRRSSYKDASLKSSLFKETNLRGADFSKSNLEGSVFVGCDLRGMNLKGTNLENVQFVDCKLDGLNFGMAKNLKNCTIESTDPKKEAVFEGKATSLVRKAFEGNGLSKSLQDHCLSGVKDGYVAQIAVVNGTSMVIGLNDASYSSIENAVNSRHEKQVVLSGADYSGLNFSKKKLPQFTAENTKLMDSTLSGCSLKNLSLENSDFSRNDFKGADLKSGQFSNVKLSSSDLAGASLENTIFKNCDLSGVSLDGTDLKNARFENCLLKGVDVSKAKNTEACRFVECVSDHGSPVINRQNDSLSLSQKAVLNFDSVYRELNSSGTVSRQPEKDTSLSM